MKHRRVKMDFETRSAVNLRTAGAFKYSLDPSTRPTCLAFKMIGESTIYFLPFEVVGRPWAELPQKLREIWSGYIEEGVEFSAHNAFFETCIYKNVLVKRLGWPDIPFRSFRCTAAKAAACALPRNLEGAGAAMNLSVQKDKRGHAAVMATCKPTAQWNNWKKRFDKGKAETWEEPPMFREPDTDPEVFDVLYRYCKIDVLAEEQLDLSLPDLNPDEQEIWFLNQKLNWRGLRIDIPTVKKIVDIMRVESKKKLKELDALTMGLVTKPGARKSILEFLALEGIELQDLRAKTVDDALKSAVLSEDMKQLLEIRKALSKTSTKKYEGMLARANDDWRVRDILMYHGASTGRDTGTGIQPHNFPRGVIRIEKDRPYAAVQDVVDCDHEMLQLLYGESLAMLFSSILRNMIIPGEGKELFVADFSKIEVAVVWWLSGNEAGLQILRDGKDPYIYQAAANLGKSYEEIEAAVNAEEPWAMDARQLGKAQILGCGFGMGWMKFKATAFDQYRLKLTNKQSRAAVKNYREANAAVPELWQNYEIAAIAAVEEPGQAFKTGRCTFFVRDGFLWAELPSGRRLAYRSPSIGWRVREYDVYEYKVGGAWVGQEEAEDYCEDKGIELESLPERIEKRKGRPQKTIEFWAVNSKTKKWQPERTWGGTLTENLVQAGARDLMMPAMVRLEKENYQALLMVHDEGICEKDIGKGSIDEFVKILCSPPKWADGLPLDAKGWKGPRYRK